MFACRILYRSYGRQLMSPAYKSLLDTSPTNTVSQLSKSRRIPPVLRRDYQQKRSESSADATIGRSLWNKLFGKYLLATNILSSGILMVIGDLAAQEIEFRRHQDDDRFDIERERYDMKRLGRMFVVGALQGPLHHYVYKWMDQVMPIVNVKNTLRKILIDQLFMSPACILIFFYSACYLEQRSIQETNTEFCDKFPIIYLMDWTVWPAAQYINFRYLDTKYRVMFVNVCTALYNIFLSYIKHDY